MNRIEPKLDFEPKDNYGKAKKLLLETDKAIQALTPQEQQKLAQEFFQYKGLCDLYQILYQGSN